MENTVKLAFIIALIGIVVIAGPWCLIWAINTIAVEAGWITAAHIIPFTFWTWLAAVLIGGLAIVPGQRRG